jgi:biotin carboxyl carrier protein
MKLQITIDGREYSVDLRESLERITVNVNGKDFPFTKENEPGVCLVSEAPQAQLPRRDFSQKEIEATIGGVISEVFVNAGDVVKAGDKLLTLSAMKMENEIVASGEGRVKEVKVKASQKVKEGDVLIVFA